MDVRKVKEDGIHASACVNFQILPPTLREEIYARRKSFCCMPALLGCVDWKFTLKYTWTYS